MIDQIGGFLEIYDWELTDVILFFEVVVDVIKEVDDTVCGGGLNFTELMGINKVSHISIGPVTDKRITDGALDGGNGDGAQVIV